MIPGRVLLIDGDVVAFVAAAAAQENYEDEFGFVYPFANRHVGESIVDNMMIGLEQELKAERIRVIISDPKENWRNSVYPAYKQNRKGSARPLLLMILKDYLVETYGAEFWPSLEADDVLGILSTDPTTPEGEERIIVGKDKDFKTIPGKYHRLKDFDAKGHPVILDTTPWEAQRFHLFQTLAGDAVDGYPGCPNLGAARVPALLDNPVLLRPKHGVITRGPNKGSSTTQWVAEPTRDWWALVVTHFEKAGQTEEDALTMARVANILHYDQYNQETQELTLWTPDRLRAM